MRARLHDLLPRGEAERNRALPWLFRPALLNQPDDDPEGGGGDPPDDDPDADPDDDPDDDDPPEETDPVKLREQLAATQAKLKRANARLAKKNKPADPKDKPADDDAAKAANERAEASDRRAVRAAGQAALVAAGVTDPGSRKLLLGQLPGLDAVEWDGDDPDLEDWVDELREDYPALFKPAPAAGTPNRRQRGSVDQGAGTAPPPKKELSYGEQLVRASMGGGGRRPRR